jgi:hypothetical protein
MEPLMDPTPFPADADAFYSRRDHRTNAYGQVDVRYAHRSVLITGETRALKTFAGQVMFLITCNLLARWCRRVFVAVPEVALHERFRVSGPLIDLALNTMHDADPFGQFQSQTTLEGDLHIHLGDECPQLAGRSTIVTCAGWLAGVRRWGESGLTMGDSDNPIGAAHAAVLAGAQVFRDALERGELYPPGFIFDALTGAPWISDSSVEANLPQDLSLGHVLMTGAGSVASSALFFGDLFGLSARIDLVDADWTKIENFARSPVFGRADYGRYKVDALAEHFAGSSLTVRPIPAWWHEADLSPMLEGYDVVLPLANEHGIRWELQNRVPPLMVHASTGRNWNVNFARHIPVRDDCLVDRFEGLHDKPVLRCAEGDIAAEGPTAIDAALPFLSFFAGLLVATDLVRLALPHYPHTPNFAHYSFRANRFMPQFDTRGPRTGCICKDQHDLFWQLRGNTRHAWLSAPARPAPPTGTSAEGRAPDCG